MNLQHRVTYPTHNYNNVESSTFLSDNTAIAISTYNMIAYTQKRAADSQEVSETMCERYHAY